MRDILSVFKNTNINKPKPAKPENIKTSKRDECGRNRPSNSFLGTSKRILCSNRYSLSCSGPYPKIPLVGQDYA